MAKFELTIRNSETGEAWAFLSNAPSPRKACLEVAEYWKKHKKDIRSFKS